MPGSLRRLLHRLSDRVDRSARGTAIPAGTEPVVPGERPKPTARERTLMRRRLRTLRRRREALMLEVGGGVLESRRAEGADTGRLDGKTAELEQVDREARELAQALDELKTLDEVIAADVARRCPSWGELVGGRESYCSSCGTSLKGPRPATGEPGGAQRPPARVGGRPGATTTAAATGRGPSGGGAPPPPPRGRPGAAAGGGAPPPPRRAPRASSTARPPALRPPPAECGPLS